MKRITVILPVGTLLALVVAVGLIAGCGSGKTTVVTVPGKTTPAKSSPGVSTSTPSTSPRTSSGSLPRYQPSTVVSEAAGSLQLTSPDSVQQVTTFYDSALSDGGWTIISSSKTGYSTNITAKRGSTGTTLSVSSTGSGTYISLVTYPI